MCLVHSSSFTEVFPLVRQWPFEQCDFDLIRRRRCSCERRLFKSVHLGVAVHGNVLNCHLERGNLLFVESLGLQSDDDLVNGKALTVGVLLSLSLFLGRILFSLELSLIGLSLGFLSVVDNLFSLSLLFGHAVLGFKLGLLLSLLAVLLHLFDSILGLIPLLLVFRKHGFVGQNPGLSGVSLGLRGIEEDEESSIILGTEVVSSHSQEVLDSQEKFAVACDHLENVGFLVKVGSQGSGDEALLEHAEVVRDDTSTLLQVASVQVNVS